MQVKYRDCKSNKTQNTLGKNMHDDQYKDRFYKSKRGKQSDPDEDWNGVCFEINKYTHMNIS